MTDPAGGPFLFDTSADSYFDKTPRQADRDWLQVYVILWPLQVSVITVIERLRRYALLIERTDLSRRSLAEAARNVYIEDLREGAIIAGPLAGGASRIAAELLVRGPNPPGPPRQSHRFTD